MQIECNNKTYSAMSSYSDILFFPKRVSQIGIITNDNDTYKYPDWAFKLNDGYMRMNKISRVRFHERSVTYFVI